jgi:hypothetical protein
MNAPYFCWHLGERWTIEGALVWGLLLGFTVLVKPTAGLGLNLGPCTLLIWRAGF